MTGIVAAKDGLIAAKLAHRAVIFVLIAFGCIVAPSALAAEGERVLDPELSLIGGCTEETLDPVEDPGCPTMPPSGAHPPSGFFTNPKAVATDFYGNIFVASFGKEADGSGGRIDIFSPAGRFITELNPTFGPMALAVDSKGVLYIVVEKNNVTPTKRQVLRYTPCAPYEPEAGKIEYCNAPALVEERASLFIGLAINAANDHLFARYEGSVVEYTSAIEGNGEVRTIMASGSTGLGVALDVIRDRLYTTVNGDSRIDIFDLSSATKIDSIEDSSVPAGDLGSRLSIAVNEGTGHVFVLDTENCNLYEFDEDGDYLATIDFPIVCTFGGEIGVDNGPFSPNGVLGSEGHYLYVPSHKPPAIGHSFAFKESHVGDPEVSAPEAANISESEAELRAQINPNNATTTYTIHYISAEQAEENEAASLDPFTGASLAGEGELAAGAADVKVAALAAGLEAGVSYRFRIRAENEKGSAQAEGSFTTYPSIPLSGGACANALLRTGPSALLPDCRAYELVTPPDTNGRVPAGDTRELNSFTTRQVSPGGEALPFKVEGGSLPGYGGTGSFLGDPYLATRTAGGWQTAYVGPSGAEAKSVIPGGSSPDKGYSFWVAELAGSAVLGGATSYVRFPDGHSELIGQGTLGTDIKAVGQLISQGGDHIIFTSGGNTPAVQLEPDAAPDGTAAIYDRIPNPETGERETKVVSLDPEDNPFKAGEDATYMGASLNGEGIAFKVDGTLYLRYRNEETFEIGEGLTYAGFAAGGGNRVFYLKGGDLFAFDVEAGEIEFTDTGDVTPVYLAAEGSAAYFVSQTAIPGSGPNPEGAEPQGGKQNLYLAAEEGQETSFVATLTDRDVDGELLSGIETVDGLGLWVDAANPFFPGRYGKVPARASADGGVLLFKSRAQLTDYDPEEKAQIYRYEAATNELRCLSCIPTGAPPSGDATLQSERPAELAALFSALAWLESLRADGNRAFFESPERLVPGDSDGLNDVYEWEAQGVGGCTLPDGCLYLISSPHSLRAEYLWAVSESGDDVFFYSSELLVGADADKTASIYDARVGGGFAEAPPLACEGEGCRPQLSPPPLLPAGLTPVLGPGDNVKRKKCPKGKRRVKRAGKVRCVKKHKKHRHHKAAGRGGARK